MTNTDHASLFDAARACITRSFIESTFGGKGSYWKGDNFYCINPSRSDSAIGSFSIREDGKCYDFADPNSSIKDVFDLLAAMTGTDSTKAAIAIVEQNPSLATERAKNNSFKDTAASRGRGTIEADWKPFEELPGFADPQPTLVTTYYSRAIDGDPMFIVVRRDTLVDGENKKEIFPMYYTGAGWKKGLPPSLNKLRPLLPFNPEKTVLIVEGEKCQARAAQLPNYSATTWHGGVGSCGGIDIEGLEECDVILWPDNDDVGKTTMLDLAVRLRNAGCSVRMVAIPPGMPKGWDIADCIDNDGLQSAIELLEVSRVMSDQELGVEAPVDAKEKRNYTDLGNAERFLDRYGRILRFNAEKGRWCVWDNRRWSDKEQSAITPMVKETIRSIVYDDPDAALYAMECESRGRISAMIDLASRDPLVAAHETDFDAKPFLLNCLNGMVDLATGNIMPHDPEMLCAALTNANFNPEAECPRFMDFLADITLGREEIILFLQRWFGYSITADVSAQTFAVFYGNGANGKSTLVELISRIVGDYVRTAPPETFTLKNGGSGIPNDVASLRGARLVLATETEANARLAESRVKAMTGGDVVVARFLHGEFFSFSPTWKIVISTNHRPRISGADYGIWRRIVLVPFDFVAQGEKLDYNLGFKLWEEREGILAWIIKGAKDWIDGGMGRSGLAIPNVLMEETQEYREDEDTIGRFIRNCCTTATNDKFFRSPDQLISGATQLFKQFVAWAEEEGEHFASKTTQTAFGRAMRERGYDSRIGRKGLKEYVGVMYNNHPEEGN